MAKIKLEVANNVSMNREGKILRAGDTFEAERDDEIEQWQKHGYIEQVTTARRKTTRTKPRGKTTKKS